MANNYCDFITGDDATGDGAHDNPYKTITTASIGLTGGDEVRVAKSAANIDLSGTLTFVDGSSSISTSVDLTGVLSQYDFIYKTGESDNILEISSITPSTITLYGNYRGTSETVSAKKLGVTDTGISTYAQQIQVASSSGISDLSRLKISGGWNLSTQIQEGVSIFRQNGGNTNGYALYIYEKSYIEIENLGFLRYSSGFYLYKSNNNIINDPICNNNDYGIYEYDSNNNTINNPICNYNEENGIYVRDSNNNIITIPICNFNSNFGICLNDSHENNIKTVICNENNTGMKIDGINNAIETITCNLNSEYGIHLEQSYNNAIFSPTCNNNGSWNIYSNFGKEDIVNKYLGVGNDVNVTSTSDSKHHILRMQHYQTEGDNRCYYKNGITYSNTAEAISNQCLRYEPTSDTYYIQQKFRFPVLNGIGKNITFYIKDDVAFNGDVQAALFFMGVNITNWETISTTTDYVLKTLSAQTSDITEDGVIELKIKVRGVVGNVYIDVLSSKDI